MSKHPCPRGTPKDEIGLDTPTPPLPLRRLCHNMKKTNFLERGEADGWKRFRAVTFSRSESDVPTV